MIGRKLPGANTFHLKAESQHGQLETK